MHPRLAINSLSTATWTLDQDLELYAELGVHSVALFDEKLGPDGVDRVLDAGLRVVHYCARGFVLHDPSTWADDQARLRDAIDKAVALDAPWFGMTSGSALGLSWDDAVSALGRALEPLRRDDIRLTVEQTLPIRPEIGFVHSLRDTFDLGERLDVGATMECNYCFAERDVDATIRANIARLATVQFSDLVPPSTVVPDRAVPGDGIIPLKRLFDTVDGAGYAGAFEIEQLGPRIESEGYASALRRAITAADDLLPQPT